ETATRVLREMPMSAPSGGGGTPTERRRALVIHRAARALRGGRDGLVEPEHVVGVVLRLPAPQPLPGRAGVGRADALRALVGEEPRVSGVVARELRRAGA